MRKFLKSTMASLLVAALLLSSNICFAQAAQEQQFDTITGEAVNQPTLAIKKVSIKKVYQLYNKFMKNKAYEKRMTKQEISDIRESEKSKESCIARVGYKVLDVDQNGIPELLVTSANYTPVVNPVYLYTYKGNKVIYIGKMQLSEEETISFTGPRYNAKTKKLWMTSGDEMMYYVAYKYDGKSIKREKKYDYSEENYNEKKIEKVGKMSGKDIEFYNNTSKSRSQHLTFRLNKSSLTLYKADKAKLKVTGKLSGLKWSSNNPKVADVKNGMVTAKKKGKAVIKATLNGTTVKCKVTVKDFNADKFMKKYVYGQWYVDEPGSEHRYDFPVKFSKHKFYAGTYDVTHVVKKPNQNVYIYMIRRSDKVRMRYTVYKKKGYKKIYIICTYDGSYRDGEDVIAKRK